MFKEYIEISAESCFSFEKMKTDRIRMFSTKYKQTMCLPRKQKKESRKDIIELFSILSYDPFVDVELKKNRIPIARRK